MIMMMIFRMGVILYSLQVYGPWPAFYSINALFGYLAIYAKMSVKSYRCVNSGFVQ